MKAVTTAEGFGTRFLPATKKSTIQYVVGEAVTVLMIF